MSPRWWPRSWGRYTVGRAVDGLGDRLIPLRNQSYELNRAFVDQETGQLAFVLTGNPASLELYEAGTATVERLAPALRRELEATRYADELLPMFDSELSAAAGWKTLADSQIDALHVGEISRGQFDRIVLATRELFDELRQQFRAFNARLDVLIGDEIGHIRAVLVTANTSQVLVIALLVVSIVGFVVAVRRTLTQPVARLVQTVRAVADGDYGQPIRRDGPCEITEIAAAVDDMRNRLRELAQFDSVTGLVNRAEVMARLDAALQRPQTPTARLGLLYCDIDHFKQINDTLGHAVGDAVLSTMAARMRECVSLTDTVGRIGGDEILILLPDLSSMQDAIAVGERIRTLAAEPIHQFGLTVHATLSIGATLAGAGGETAASLTARADKAMYDAKQSGRNAVVVLE